MGDAQSVAQSIPTPAELAAELEHSGALLWETLAELEPEEIESTKLASGWNPKAEVAHVAFWDDYQRRRMEAALDGSSLAAGFTRPVADNDERARGDANRPWPEVEAAAKLARQQLVDFARNLAPEALARDYAEGERSFSMLGQLQHMSRHILAHRRGIQAYCGSLARWGRDGLRKLMVEQHENFMDGMAGLTEETMVAVQVCGEWSIRDVYAHVLSWNEYCSLLLRGWPEADAEKIGEWQWRKGDTFATFNARLLEARRALTMIEICDGLTTEYRRILRVFDRASDDDLVSEGLTWGGPGVMSNFFYDIFLHEAEHAAQIWAYRAGVMEEEAERNRSDDG